MIIIIINSQLTDNYHKGACSDVKPNCRQNNAVFSVDLKSERSLVYHEAKGVMRSIMQAQHNKTRER